MRPVNEMLMLKVLASESDIKREFDKVELTETTRSHLYTDHTLSHFTPPPLLT